MTKKQPSSLIQQSLLCLASCFYSSAILTVSHHQYYIVDCDLNHFISVKEAGLILLQTIPDSIDIEIFKKSLLENFKDIVSIHDLHIWQLTSSKLVSTAHIIFQNPSVIFISLFLKNLTIINIIHCFCRSTLGLSMIF